MKFKLNLTLNDVKRCPIFSGYRPTWTCSNKPDHNSGMIYWSGGNAIFPKENHEVILIPFQSQFWENVTINDVLKCMEGSRVVGEATVLEIIQDVPVV